MLGGKSCRGYVRYSPSSEVAKPAYSIPRRRRLPREVLLTVLVTVGLAIRLCNE